MVDQNTLNVASNLLVEAGYKIGTAPIPAAYTGLGTAIVTTFLSVIAVIAAAGRAIQAWKSDTSALRALFMGTNVPKALQAQVDSNTVARGAVVPDSVPTLAAPSQSEAPSQPAKASQVFKP